MKILHLAYTDTSGVPGRWAAAHRQAGHETELVVEVPHDYDYGAPETVIRWSQGEADLLDPFLDEANAIMAYDHPLYLRTAIETGKPVLYRALGQHARENAGEVIALLEAPNVVRAGAGTGEIALMLGLRLSGGPYGLLPPARGVGDVLCHAPSDRDYKGTEIILRAAQASGWKVDLVEGVSNGEALERKSRCALVVDSIGPDSVPDGYGVNGVEAMAMGLPVVTTASQPVMEMLANAGSPAVFAADEEELTTVLRGLLAAPGLRKSLGMQGRTFVAYFHSAKERAAEDTAALSLVAA